MARYSDTITDSQYGAPIQGVKVYVYDTNEALATLEEDGGGDLANPVTSDQYGGFYFNAADGLYDLVFHYDGKQFFRENHVLVGTGPELPAEIIAALIQPGAADLIGTSTGDTVQEVLDTLSTASLLGDSQPQAQYFNARIEADTLDTALFFGVDSTGNAQDEKVYLLAQSLGAEYPEKTVIYRVWGDDDQWGEEVTVSTGTGARTIYVDNFGVSGSSGYRLEGAREALIFDGRRDYALGIWSYGHNYGTTVFEDDISASILGQIAVFQRMLPRAGILVTLQNPRIDEAGEQIAQTPNMVAATLRAAMLLGCGVIDEYHAFLDSPAWGILPGEPGSLYLDDGLGTHHSIPLGAETARDAILRAIAKPAVYRPCPLNPSPLLVKRRNLMPNAIFSDWPHGAAGPTGWTFTNCTPAKDAGRLDDAPYSLRITNGAGTSPLITRDLGSLLTHVRGRYITLVARVWKTGTLDAVGGRCFLNASNGAVQTSSTSPQRLPGESVDGWSFAITTLLVPQDSTTLSFGAFTGALDGSDVGDTLNFDHIALFEGILPGQIDPDDYPLSVLDELYDDANVGLPSGYTGTLTVAGGDITLVGGPVAARAYINLPATIAGERYKATWNHISQTGGSGGTIIIRNGINGAGTVLTTVPASITWASENVTFTAPVGACNLVIAGDSGVTGFVQEDWSIVSLSSGFDAFDLPLILGRNTNGTVLDATGGAGLFKVVSTPGTSLYLEGEGAQNNTKTDTVTFVAVLPPDYLASRPVTVTANAVVAGTGTLGSTKTLTVTAYKMAANGTQGSNLGPAAATLTTSAADYTFTIDGTTLSPGDRLFIAVAASINETGNVNPITARVNSVRLS